MESGDRAAATLSSAALLRLRLAATSALLLGLAFLQAPGLLMADTKFDLAVAPDAFLSRATHLWDGEGAFGQLQNQAYGYLWPMGSFFWLGDAVGLPGWVVQRLWIALVMIVAFLGAALLVRALGVRSHLAIVLAGLAYATSPRMLSTLGPISIEAWPSSVAPWVLLPLVIGASRGSPRRAAMLAGLAVAMVGGVNATATFAVIPLGAIWLLTRQRGPRRTALMIWWPFFTLLGTLWWLIPLFLLGAFSPPFLDYIETASVTTFPTTVFDAFRGTSAWVPYVDPSWRGGHLAVTQFYLILNSGLVLALGVLGLLVCRRDRLFLVLGLLCGLLLVTMGHTGSVTGWFAEPLSGLLDAALAPARNVHKFDPIVRLPLVIGLAWAIERAAWLMGESSERRGGDPADADIDADTGAGADTGAAAPSAPSAPSGLSGLQTMGLIGVIGVVGASLPIVTADLSPTRSTVEIPGYWGEAAQWLAADAARSDNSQDGAGGDGGGVALLAPGSSFGSYLWGSPRDEPMQVLADSRWAVRNAIPLAPEGNIRLLDAIEERLATGVGSSGLAPYLARAGVATVVVRNDLVPDPDVPVPALVHQALESSPGLGLVASFGPEVGNDASIEIEERRALVEDGWAERRPAVEIYRVDATAGGTDAAVAPESVESLPVVAGGSEDLLGLLDAGLIGDLPTRLAYDVAGGDQTADADPAGPVILTDGLLERERFFGRVHDGYSAVISPGDVRRTGNPTADYLPPDAEGWSTRARFDGAASISASSSRSDADNPGGARPANLPFAAIDADPETEWISQAGVEEQTTWWQVDLAQERAVSQVSLTLGRGGTERAQVRVITESGSSDAVDLEQGTPVTVTVPVDAPTSWVRVETTIGVLSLADVQIPEVEVTRSLVLPDLPAAWGSPSAIVLRALHDARTGCVRVDGRVPCVAAQTRDSEEPVAMRRTFALPEQSSYRWSATARPRSGAELDALLQRGLGFGVRASSYGVPDPRAGAIAAADGDPGTTWVADRGDVQPTLSLNWLGEREVDELTLAVPDDAPIASPTKVRVSWGDDEDEAEDLDVADDGTITLSDPVETDGLDIQIIRSTATGSIAADGTFAPLPVGVGEVSIADHEDLGVRLTREVERFACGSGPDVTIDGSEVPTALRTSRAALYAGEVARVEACDGVQSVEWPAGAHDVDLTASDVAAPATFVALDPAAALGVGASLAPAPGDESRREVSSGGVLALRQSTNPGWEASQGGSTLRSVVLDGWQQGFVLRDDEPVDLRFVPQRPYLVGLVAGGVAWAVLVALLFLRPAPGRLARSRRFAGLERRWGGIREELWGDDDMPGVRETRAPRLVMGVVALVAGGLLGGWLGLVSAALGAALAVLGGLGGLAPRRSTAALVATLPFLAAVGYVARPWASPNGWAGEWSWPHYLVLITLGALFVATSRGARDAATVPRRTDTAAPTPPTS